jgi:ATP synthase protein I
MSDHGTPSSPNGAARDDRKRLDELEFRLRDARKGAERAPASRSTHRELGLAYRVMIEMAVGLAFGAVVGWLLDSWLGTRPLAMVVMTLLGFAAGMLNAWRTSRSIAGGPGPPAAGEDGRS